VRRVRSGQAIAPWTAAWLGGAVASGVAREATYGRTLSTRAAHQVSGLTAVGAFTTYFWGLERRWPIPTAREAAIIGGTWLGLTVAFEFGFGRAHDAGPPPAIFDDAGLGDLPTTSAIVRRT
jgi:hypothetical protein